MRRLRTADWLFALAWVAALLPAITYLRGLQWPCDVDGFRDIAMAQGIADGRWFGDPLYRGEAVWYTPLVPAAIALTSVVATVPIPRAYVLTGLWLNGLVPFAFFLCARRLIGSTPALAASVLYLFLPARPEMWAAGTYSPWAFPAITAQLPFFLGVFAWAHSLDRPTTARLLLAGMLLALTALAHGAPAVVLAGIVALTSISSALRRIDGIDTTARTKGVAMTAGTSILLVLPFLWPLAVRYGFHVRNRAPATWTEDAAKPEVLLATGLSPAAVPGWAVVFAGAWWIRRHASGAARLLSLAWPLAILAGYTLAILSRTYPAVPALVPPHHYVDLMRSFGAILAGCGVVAAVEVVTNWCHRMRLSIAPDALALPAIVVIAGLLYPQYLHRDAFKRAQSFSRGYEGMPEREVYRWIRANTDPGAVFVASDDDGLRIVGPAGRAVITVDHFFSNPYVEHSERANARDRMVEALIKGDAPHFEKDRRAFNVTHVLARGDEAETMMARSSALLTPLFRHDVLTVFAVR
jgi:hypothetical protein